MTLLVFLGLLSVLVLVHELGHFYWARKFGIKVEEFGIGLPPRLKLLFRRGGTEYSLNWLPLGGFVKLLGEDGQAQVKPEEKEQAFGSKSRWQRSLVLLGGVINNMLLGVVLFSLVYALLGVPQVKKKWVMVLQVAPGSPADLAGLRVGQVIKKLDGSEVGSVEEFSRRVKEEAGQMVRLEVAEVDEQGHLKDGSRLKSVIPRENPPDGEGALGVVITEFPEVIYERKPWYLAPFYGVSLGLKEAYAWSREIVVSFGGLVKQVVRGKVPEDLSGPVGIYRLTSKAQKGGWLMVLRLGAIISLNLAFFNLLPLPALDGGRLLFVWLEKLVSRKRLNQIEGWIHTVGFGLLMLLLLLVTWKDLLRK